jgi:hypothetical protein
MQIQNVAEYKAMRQDLTHIRNCITRYVQLVVLGIGPAFWLLASKASEKDLSLELSFAAILFSDMSLLLLSYKFTSHNRYAGYSKLLGHERFSADAVLDKHIFLWEICVDILRALDCCGEKLEGFLLKCEYPENAILGLPNLRQIVEPHSGPAPEVDRFAWLKGWGVLLWARDGSGSWKLPVYLARIFGAINLAFIFFAVQFLLESSGPRRFQDEHYAIIIMLVVLLFLWSVFVTKLYKQMHGSETIEAFCCKFLPIRLQLLRQLNKDVGYGLIGISIAQSPAPGSGGIDAPVQAGSAPTVRPGGDARFAGVVIQPAPSVRGASNKDEKEDVLKAG